MLGLEIRALTHKQRVFATEYLRDGNATKAAKRAGYSKSTAYSQGQRLLKNVEVKKIVGQRLSKLDITAERVLSEFARIGFSDLRTVFDADGRLLSLAALTDATAASISSVEVVRETTRKHGETAVTEQVTKVKAWDKVRALEALAKNLGLLKEHTVLENPDGSPIQFYVPTNGR